MGMRLLGPVYLIGGQDFHSVYLDWPANDSNVYLVDTGDDLIMVDCGCGESLEHILSNVEEMDFDLHDLTHLLLTHEHFPHAGAAQALEKMDVEIVCSESAAQAVQAGDLRTAGYHYHRPFLQCGECTTVGDGEVIALGRMEITARALPGHSPGSMGYEFFASDRKMLFCGDVVRSPELRTHRDRPGYDHYLYLESLRKLLEDPPHVLYPGHGPFCLSRGDVWIQAELKKLLADGAQKGLT
mgnify:FL=1